MDHIADLIKARAELSNSIRLLAESTTHRSSISKELERLYSLVDAIDRKIKEMLEIEKSV